MVSQQAMGVLLAIDFFFFSSRRRHTRLQGDWSSDVCSSDLSARRLANMGAGRSPSDTASRSFFWGTSFRALHGRSGPDARRALSLELGPFAELSPARPHLPAHNAGEDRKSVV